MTEAIAPDGMADRSCGGCTECCVYLNVDTPELQKPAHVPCPNLTAGGCGIYETRPPICREWNCLWRECSALPDSARPDRTGVLFTMEKSLLKSDLWFGPFYVKAAAMRSPEDFQRPEVKSVLERLLAIRSMPIWLAYRGQRYRFLPDDELTDAILNPQTTEHRHLLPLAEELRIAWNLPAPAPATHSTPSK
jgi:hypothetical protein